MTPKKHVVYPDPGDVFIREPFTDKFASGCVEGAGEIVLVGVHTQPKEAAKELAALADVADWARKEFRSK